MLQLEKPGHHTNKWLMLSQTDVNLLHSHLLSWSISRIYNVQEMLLPLKEKQMLYVKCWEPSLMELSWTFSKTQAFQNFCCRAEELKRCYLSTRQLMHRTNGRISTSARITAPLYFQAPTSNYKKEHIIYYHQTVLLSSTSATACTCLELIVMKVESRG